MNIFRMEKFENFIFVILAAGMGKRLGGDCQKTVRKILGKPILKYLLETIKKFKPEKIVVVVGYKKEEVFKELEDEDVEYVEQKELKGTGDAVLQTETILKDFKGDIVVLNGDTPLISENTIKNLLKIHRESKSYCTFLTTFLDEPKGYGRVVRDGNGNVLEIIEEIDADEEQKKIKEVNAGVYVFRADNLFSSLKKIELNPLKQEYYLTDIIKIFNSENKKIATYTTPFPEETVGINTLEDLKKVEDYLLKRSKKWIVA
ncbi:MAG: sugar phosphate nucleotidyltransferase [Candidatus Omnitrophica bacterium]|nr:sugar phosphate nucleotidyltransferase [Candidatus Omnitrophota bacterium]MCM8807710.1 sugar phosphate nucleotidyltransferase [Candidatus Omnitrophota bacterium]